MSAANHPRPPNPSSLRHAAYWASCADCETRTLELEAEGLTRSDAQGVAETEHAEARFERDTLLRYAQRIARALK
jgi:hypothetical protein